MKTYGSIEAAIELNVDRSRILQYCRQGRLGYTLPKVNGAWVITQEELDKHRAEGPRRRGKRPKPKKLVRIAEDGNHEWQ